MGKVTVAGTPLQLPEERDENGVIPRGLVMYLPQAVPGVPVPLLATGAIDKEGNYRLMTGGKPGAPVGRYKVVVTVGATFALGKDGRPEYRPRKTNSFDERYSQIDRTPFIINVVDNPKPGAYDLDLTR
jgi:hypothetical protein